LELFPDGAVLDEGVIKYQVRGAFENLLYKAYLLGVADWSYCHAGLLGRRGRILINILTEGKHHHAYDDFDKWEEMSWA